MGSPVASESRLKNSSIIRSFRSSPLPIADFMAALSDPGGFSKAAEKQNEATKMLGIEQMDSKAEAKKKEEPKRGNKIMCEVHSIIFMQFFSNRGAEIGTHYVGFLEEGERFQIEQEASEGAECHEKEAREGETGHAEESL